MEAYGYIFTEITGDWSVAFEISCFTPRGFPDQRWWLDEFGDTKYDFQKKETMAGKQTLYHLSGFLSPEGKYGHMGRYDHEFYATKVVLIRDED